MNCMKIMYFETEYFRIDYYLLRKKISKYHGFTSSGYRLMWDSEQSFRLLITDNYWRLDIVSPIFVKARDSRPHYNIFLKDYSQ